VLEESVENDRSLAVEPSELDVLNSKVLLDVNSSAVELELLILEEVDSEVTTMELDSVLLDIPLMDELELVKETKVELELESEILLESELEFDVLEELDESELFDVLGELELDDCEVLELEDNEVLVESEEDVDKDESDSVVLEKDESSLANGPFAWVTVLLSTKVFEPTESNLLPEASSKSQ